MSKNSISSVDGRYEDKTKELTYIFSEQALNYYRRKVELYWLIALSNQKNINKHLILLDNQIDVLNKLVKEYDYDFFKEVKNIEKKTNHDVKSVEYALKKILAKNGFSKNSLAFVHFACTSEDINNISYSMMIDDAKKVISKYIKKIIIILNEIALSYKNLGLLSKTHGQAASPTTLGKEFVVFAYRLKKQYDKLISHKLECKINGAVGNYNAHHIAFENIDWIEFSKKFVENYIKLDFNPITTQIENHDSLIELFNIIQRINTIMIGLNQDIWAYISIDYFILKSNEDEIGSSTMPHKINPIDFENSEGNLGISNSLLKFYSDKLLISRWQRDLSDSTVMRSIGTSIGHGLLGYKSLINGLNKIYPNKQKIKSDLDNAWQVLAEPIQTIMKKYGYEDSYDDLKKFSRGHKLDKKQIQNFIKSIKIPEFEKEKLLNLTPEKYTGKAHEIVEFYFNEFK